MGRVLFVAYHFPPLAGSSGIQRTLRFVQQLPDCGWQAAVLTAHPRAYERISDDLLPEIPPGTPLVRAQAFDTARQLSFRGKYLAGMARPDRWMTWRFFAVREGMKLIDRFKPDVLVSTYPIATAHQIGHRLHQKTGLPWVADFRDPMAQDGYPADPKTHRVFVDIERAAMKDARFSVFTTPGAAAEYRRRYAFAADRIRTIENGYDESAFTGLSTPVRQPLPGTERVVLLHSGIVYPSERDPTQLMKALALLAARGDIEAGRFTIRFRASAADDFVRKRAAEQAVLPFIEFAPAVPYRQALAEMCEVDGLLVMQASNCNEQIPAKVYEYLRSGSPIMCLSDPQGDTAETLRRAGVTAIAPLDDPQAIAALLVEFLRRPASGHRWHGTDAAVRAASRAGRARELAQLLTAASQ